MDGIAKTNPPVPNTAAPWSVGMPGEHPALALWVGPGTGLLHRLQVHFSDQGVHPARALVLLPHAGQLTQARRLWADTFPDGFMPRFETCASWAASTGRHEAQATDIHFDAALDRLMARSLLDDAGLSAHARVLVEQLVECAHQLGPLVAATAPADRAAWAHAARQTLSLDLGGQALQWELAVARIALEWALASSYPVDQLFEPDMLCAVDALVLVQGSQADPLAKGLQTVWAGRLSVMPFAWEHTATGTPDTGTKDTGTMGDSPGVTLHACEGSEDEAQRAAACVLQHIGAGRFPVALVCSDRALTRRISALLDSTGVPIRDENGWKLSTSASAATLMALLKATTPQASSDSVLHWLKLAPEFAPHLSALEAVMRRAQLRHWHAVADHPAVRCAPALASLYASAQAVLQSLSGRHPLTQWLTLLRQALQTSGMWQSLQQDAAGAQVLAMLRLDGATSVSFRAFADRAHWRGKKLDAAEFTAWVDHTLENSHFVPPHPVQEQVTIVSLHHMPGRPFAALVLAGCDEVRLCPSPEPAGSWTAAQRSALGLPGRDELARAMRSAWRFALQTPLCDVLWRTGDDSGESLLPSPLVQLVRLDRVGKPAQADPRALRSIPCRPVLPPRPVGAELNVTRLTQSAYEDLRQCPYRFFAMRQLGLGPVNELEDGLGKRDFGVWLHEVLKRFHTGLAHSGSTDPTLWPALLDVAQVDASVAMDLAQDEFLPWVAAWPAVRDHYLEWLAAHMAQGLRFSEAEAAYRQSVGSVVLQGRIDRIDATADGQPMVLDYKTENLANTVARVKDPLEDTQIAFYAALLPHDTLRAAYVNVSEKETRLVEQNSVVQARDALVDGIANDMQRIAAGAALPALGEGAACTFCQARGLCRKDFWVTP